MEPSKPDFRDGFRAKDLSQGGIAVGRVADEDALLVHVGEEFFVVGASCSHYHGPLSDGLVVGDTLRCPWHHACFSLRNGEALRAPAFDPIPCWRVEVQGEMLFAREKQTPQRSATLPARKGPASVVIVGGGAAGFAAADTLRREGYLGSLTMITADDSAPYDRPNLSKDFLAGTAPEDWIPLRPPDYYTKNAIDLVTASRVASLDPKERKVLLEGGRAYDFDALLIATGAEPIRISIEGATDSQVHYLRSLSDSRDLLARAASARRVVVVGASFIGLEVAAALRSREIPVDVVAPETVPLERILGPEIGRFVLGLHEARGVVFHLGETVRRVDGRKVTLSGGGALDADFLVLGIGVRPVVALAEQAGLAMDRGIAVDEYLETSVPGIFAAGDVARWPDPHTGQRIRVEHWVVAERQGQVAARNILGRREKFTAVPFFWSQHYDTQISYVGHAEQWDEVEIDGELSAGDCSVSYKRGGKVLAVATILRDHESLKAEAVMESSS